MNAVFLAVVVTIEVGWLIALVNGVHWLMRAH